MLENVPSVTDLVNQIKNNLEGQFRNVTIVGEVTNLSSSASGHWYFSLSDSQSLINAACFRMDAARNHALKTLKDGDKVVCQGSISVYNKRGSFQLITKRISPIGKGDLKEQFEKLKVKLRAEGLFDSDVKVPIPSLPRRVAVITAKGGAALQDFLNIIKRRSLFLDVVVVPALVQGDTAPRSIRNALNATIKYQLENEKNGHSELLFDAIVLTRGGGSLEDLWAFNDEALAWDIYNCPIPIISAVGHQVDFSISDFVSDLRVETPSAAAEVLTNEQNQIKERMENCSRRLKVSSTHLVSKYRLRVGDSHPMRFASKLKNRIHELKERLLSLHLVSRKYELVSFSEYHYELDMLVNSLKSSLKNRIERTSHKLDRQNQLLSALNPRGVLTRGYAFTEVEGKVISSKKEMDKVKVGSSVIIHYDDGKSTLQKGGV